MNKSKIKTCSIRLSCFLFGIGIGIAGYVNREGINIVNVLAAMQQKGRIQKEEDLKPPVRTIENENIQVKEVHEVEEYKAKDGTVIFTVDTNWPVVNIPEYNEVQEKINTQIKELKGVSLKEKEEYLDSAKENYTERGNQVSKNWGSYRIYQDYTIGRADNKVFSVDRLQSEYAGGAHPNTNRFGFTFDLATGKRLKLEDVTTDEKAFHTFVADYLLQLSKESKYQEYWLEDYESYLSQVLTEDTWYLSEQGFVVISNPYLISPYAAGILYFVIPYEELRYFNPQYAI